MEIKKQLEEAVKNSIKSLAGEDTEVKITIPNDISKGDFTTNIAMIAFGNLKSQILNVKSPIEFAEKIVEVLNTKYMIPDTFDRIEFKAPGFINFFLSEAQIGNQVNSLLESSNLSKKIEDEENTPVILEFGDLNPFKEPHLGHMRNLVLGESLARLTEAQNIKVHRANYEGDVGMHVAKAIYGMIKLHFDTFEGNEEEKAKFLGKAYAHGAGEFESNPDAKQEIIEINKKVYAKDAEIMTYWELGRKISLDYFETLYKALGIKYEKYYFESVTAPIGLEIVNENLGKVFEKDNGAIIFRGENYGLHTRVFITSQGNPMYEAKDLALSFLKEKDFKGAKSIIMTANEQTEYFKVMLSALNLIDPKIAEKTSHLSYGFLDLKDGKMSSRTGDVVSAFWLLDEVRNRLKKGFREVSQNVLEDLTVGSIRWGMLKFSRESSVIFSIDESIQIEGNSGPYMMYTYARTQSLIGKSSFNLSEAKLRENFDPELLALGRMLCQFEMIKKDAFVKFSPNILTEYLFILAQKFNGFYEREKIVGSENEDQKMLIVKAVGQVIKEGLFLLGIDSPEKI